MVNQPGPTVEAPTSDHMKQLHELHTAANQLVHFSELFLQDPAFQSEGPFGSFAGVLAISKRVLELVRARFGADESPSSKAELVELHTQMMPHLHQIIHRCEHLATIAEYDGPAAYVPELLKIVGAAAHLSDLAAGTASTGSTAATSLATGDNAGGAQAWLSSVAGGKVLIVDDNQTNRDLLDRQLERLGYTTAHASGGHEALELLRSQPFDLVLLDIVMNDLSGYDVLTAIRAEPTLEHVSVIVLAPVENTRSVVRAVELGADDYVPKPFDLVLLRARISACLFKKHLHELEVNYVRRIEDEKRRADHLLNAVIPLGVALSVEKDFNLLLEKIVLKAQELTRAEGGTLYLRTEEDILRFMIVRNPLLDIAMGGASGTDIPFPPLRLYDEKSGAPLLNYVVIHAAISGKTINIADAYDAEDYDFSGTREFDLGTGYRTTSVLNIPLRDGLGRVIGVLQLINARNEKGQIIAFDEVAVQMIESLSALAAAALAAYTREEQLRQEISNLRIEIDHVKKQREVEEITSSPYFAAIQERVPELRGGKSSQPRARPGITRTSFVVNNQQIAAREQGTARGRPVLLIHGWSSSWYALSPLMSTLADRHRCIAVDLPGYGASPPLPQRTTIDAYVDLLAGLISQLSPGLPIPVIGHSMGGMIALSLALRYPDLLDRMILICPTVSGRLSFWINSFVSTLTMFERSPLGGSILARLELPMLRLTDRLMRPASFADRTDISEADYHRFCTDARQPGQGRIRAECFTAMRMHSLDGDLAQIKTPALVIWGMEDHTVPLRDASMIAEQWPAAELRVLPGAGHWPQFEAPEPTRRYVRAFLSTPTKLLRSQL